jgi:1-acyl-sn-glycerol-3-phosphate acyltransferase
VKSGTIEDLKMNATRLIRQLFWAFGWCLLLVTVVPFCRLRTRGRRNIPSKGPVLLYGNHTTFFDPVLVYWSALRRIHGVGSDQFFKFPILGPLMTWFSVIPFSKGDKDRQAMAEISRRSQQGAAILIFPEGNRSWTGHFQPIKDSNGRLAKRLDCPVVCVRFDTGHLHWPRWARYPRLLPVEIEYLPPKTYPQDMSDAEVTADITRQLTIDPLVVKVPRYSWGFRLAWGLEDFLWACPHCFSLKGLEPVKQDGDLIACPSCQARWKVDLACNMNATAGPATDTSVDAAWKCVLAHFGELPVVDQGRFEATGLALQCAQAELAELVRSTQEPPPLGRGVLSLYRDRLVFDCPEAPLEIPLVDVVSVIMQMGDKLQLRLEGISYQLNPMGQRRHMWLYFLRAHLAQARAERHAAG